MLGENSFVGRSGLLTELEAELERQRSVVLVGPPGVGKTRLASECVRRRGGASVTVKLNDVRDLDGFLTRMAHSVGASVPATTRSEIVGRIQRSLAGRAADIFVLDGIERLPAEAEPIIGSWMGAAHPRFILTSRRRVAITCVSLDVPPLGVEPESGEGWSDAAELLCKRAVELARVRLEPADRQAAQALVRALDGLPLAIELAAARLGVLSVEQLLGRLTDRFRTLAEREGETGLGSSIRASFELLDADARACLVACAVFRGGIRLEALEAVAPAEVDVISALMAARNHSLLEVVRHGDSLRYHLAESVRDWLEDHACGDASWVNARRRHAEYWDRCAPALLRDPERARLEVDNLGVAFETAKGDSMERAARLAIVLADPRLCSPYRACIERIRSVRECAASGGLPPALLGRLALGSGTMLRFASDFAGSSAELEDALGHARSASDSELEAEALVGLGLTASARGLWHDSRAYLTRALEVHPEESKRSLPLAMIANTYVNQERLDVAEALLRESIALGLQHADPFAEAFARLSLGVLLVERGDFDEAFGELLDAMSLLESGQSVRLMHARHLCAFALTHIARVRQESRDLAGALVDYHRARSIAAEEGARRAETFAVCGLVGLLLEMRELRAAEDELARALPLMRENGKDYEGVMVAMRGVLFAMQGATLDAERLFAHAEKLLALADKRVFGAALEVLRGRTAPLSSELERAADVRLARRLREQFSSRQPEKPLLIARDASFFRLFGQEHGVPLERRRAVREVLRALVEARSRQPGVPVSVETLVAAGWPGERILPAAAAGRVYTAISTLRRLGLRNVVEQSGTGYLIPAEVPIVFHDQPDAARVSG
ncbi:MAG: AAA family ATPase [Polyangiaceae bacterium]